MFLHKFLHKACQCMTKSPLFTRLIGPEVSALRFSGLTQYREFWDNFRSGVELVSASAISEVVNVVQSGLYLRVRWRLIMKPKDVPMAASVSGVSRFGQK